MLLAENKLRCTYYLLCCCLWGTRGLKEVCVKSHKAHNEEPVPVLQGTGRGRVSRVISVYAPATESEGSCQSPPGNMLFAIQACGTGLLRSTCTVIIIIVVLKMCNQLFMLATVELPCRSDFGCSEQKRSLQKRT